MNKIALNHFFALEYSYVMHALSVYLVNYYDSKSKKYHHILYTLTSIVSADAVSQK